MLPKLNRLTRQEFIQVRKNGKSYNFPHFSLLVLKNSPAKFSVVTSSKFSKNAVIRNRFRRNLYQVFKNYTSGHWLIFYPKPSMLKLSRDQINSLLNSFLSPLLVP